MKERIQDLTHADNFVPFTILMADGKEYHVPTRDHVFAPRVPKASILVISDTGSATFIPSLLISGINVAQSEAA